MASIDEIRNKLAERNETILKAFGQESNKIEKGGRAAVIGEIRTFGGREYIKTHEGWKFHGKGTGTKAKAHVEGAKHQINQKIGAERDAIRENNYNSESEFQEQRLLEQKRAFMAANSDKSGSKLKEKVDLAQGGAAGIRALMEREKLNKVGLSKIDPEEFKNGIAESLKKIEARKKEPEKSAIKSKFESIEKNKFDQAVQEQKQWNTKLEEYRSKGWYMNDRKLDAWKKRVMGDALRKREIADKNIERAQYGHSVLKGIFKDENLTATTHSSTAIRGFTRASKGYEFNQYDQSSVDFNGLSENEFDSMVKKVKDAGFSVIKENKPSRTIGGPSNGSIKIEKLYNFK